VAIVFPKHNEPPLEGAEISDEAAARARARQQQLELAGKAGDLRAVLTERRRRASLASTREPGKGEAS